MSVTSAHESKPYEIKTARAALPIAWLGLGILEWHGLHNPAGLDGMKADGLARRFCQRFGGVVVPPLFWGDNRAEICELVFSPQNFPHLDLDHTPLICDAIGYDKAKLESNAQRSLQRGGWRLWKELLCDMFWQLESFGFRSIVPIPGHYPLFTPLEEAIAQYHNEGGSCDVFPLKDTMYDPINGSGDHAAKFETSLMMALAPELVDLSRLDADLSKPNIGVMGEDPRDGASAEFGERIIQRFYELIETHLKEIGLI